MDGDNKNSSGPQVFDARQRKGLSKYLPFRKKTNKQKAKKHPQRKRYLLVLSLILVVTLVGNIYLSQKRLTKDLCNGDPNSKLYKQAGNVSNPSATAELRKVVTTIKNSPRYDTDPTCLYIVTNFYITVSDAKNSELYFTKLKKVYKSQKDVIQVGSASIKSLERLDFEVKALLERERNFEANYQRYNERTQ